MLLMSIQESVIYRKRSRKQVKSRIVSLYQDYEYLLEMEKLSVSEKSAYQKILTEMSAMDDVTACDSLNNLCRYLEHVYGKKVIVLQGFLRNQCFLI